jgi:hypothetical protein
VMTHSTFQFIFLIPTSLGILIKSVLSKGLMLVLIYVRISPSFGLGIS